MPSFLDWPAKPGCVTIGNFDSVHLGHQSLISLARETARQAGLLFTLITFWPHPRTVLKGKSAHSPLTSRAERMRLLSALDIDNIVELPFTSQLASLSAFEFVEKFLLPLNMKELVIGHDFSLGKDRQGNCEYLAGLGKKLGFTTRQAPAFRIHGEPVSSTRLRKAIAAGDMQGANAMLGRTYSLEGRVAKGFGRGAGLGFPTANVGETGILLPGAGVYATWARVGGQRHASVTNIGNNPTFGNGQVTVECHLLEGGADLYDKPLRVEFVERLRPERKFSSPAELVAQIRQDTAKAAAILADAAG